MTRWLRDARVQLVVLLVALHAYKGVRYGFGVCVGAAYYGEVGTWRCGNHTTMRVIDPYEREAYAARGLDLATTLSGDHSRAWCVTHATNHTDTIIVSFARVPDSKLLPRPDDPLRGHSKPPHTATAAEPATTAPEAQPKNAHSGGSGDSCNPYLALSVGADGHTVNVLTATRRRLARVSTSVVTSLPVPFGLNDGDWHRLCVSYDATQHRWCAYGDGDASDSDARLYRGAGPYRLGGRYGGGTGCVSAHERLTSCPSADLHFGYWAADDAFNCGPIGPDRATAATATAAAAATTDGRGGGRYPLSASVMVWDRALTQRELRVCSERAWLSQWWFVVQIVALWPVAYVALHTARPALRAGARAWLRHALWLVGVYLLIFVDYVVAGDLSFAFDSARYGLFSVFVAIAGTALLCGAPQRGGGRGLLDDSIAELKGNFGL